MRENNNLVNVHSSAIHIENKVGLKSRLAWFYMLYKAFPVLKDQNSFTITIGELKKAIGYTSTNNQHLKEVVEELARTEIQWNLFGKDGHEWGISHLLSQCIIKTDSNIIYYEYSSFVKEKLSNPEMYVKINLLVSKNFKSKHTLSLYCLALDYLYIKNNYGEKTLTLEEMRTYLGLEDYEYKTAGELYKHVLKKSEEEINTNSDLNINIDVSRGERSKITGFKLKMSIKDDFLNNYKPNKKNNENNTIIENVLIEEKTEVNKTNPKQINLIENIKTKEISKSKDIIKPIREIIRIESKELKEFFLQYKISITTNTIQDKFSELKEMLEHRFEGYVTYLMEYTKNQIKVSNVTNVSGFFVGLLRTDSQFENYITEEQRKDNIRLSKEGRVKALIESKIKENYNKYIKNDFSYYLESNIDELEEQIIKIVELTHKKDTLFYDFAIKSKNNGLIDNNLLRTNDRGVKTLLFNHLEEHKDKFDYEPLTFEEWKNQEITDEYLKELETELLKTL